MHLIRAFMSQWGISLIESAYTLSYKEKRLVKDCERGRITIYCQSTEGIYLAEPLPSQIGNKT